MKPLQRLLFMVAALVFPALSLRGQSADSPMQPDPPHSDGAKILRPQNGTLAHPGDTIQIDAVLDEGVSPVNAIAILSDIGTSENYRESAPYSFTFRIPVGEVNDNRPLLGFHNLSVFGTVHGRKNFDLASVVVEVEELELPVELYATGDLEGRRDREPNSANFLEAGSDVWIRIYGKFANGHVLDVTQSSYLSMYSSNPSVARVPTREAISSIGPGDAKIVVTYTLGSQQKQLEIPVHVKISNMGLIAEPGFLDFEEQRAGTKSEPRVVKITNQSGRPIKIGELKLYGFGIQDDTCGNATLPADGSCTFGISFMLPQAGYSRVPLEIPNDYDRLVIPLSGTAN